MYEMQEQTTNLNGDDFLALRCFDSNKAISHITGDNQENMKYRDVGLSAGSFFPFPFFGREKVERNQPQQPQRQQSFVGIVNVITQISQ